MGGGVGLAAGGFGAGLGFGAGFGFWALGFFGFVGLGVAFAVVTDGSAAPAAGDVPADWPPSPAAGPDDGPSRVMIERCRIYCETPPEDGWDGVFVATSK